MIWQAAMYSYRVKKEFLLLFLHRHVSRQNSEIEKEEKEQQHVISEVKIGSQNLVDTGEKAASS
jgi:hypothetical protein